MLYIKLSMPCILSFESNNQVLHIKQLSKLIHQITLSIEQHL